MSSSQRRRQRNSPPVYGSFLLPPEPQPNLTKVEGPSAIAGQGQTRHRSRVVVVDGPQPNALEWQISDNGTYPEFDRTIETYKGQLPTLDPQACETCREITISDLLKVDPPYGYEHHSSEKYLLASASKGCRLCIWICYALFLDPLLEGTTDKWATRAPIREALKRHYRYPPILRFSKTRGGLRIQNPFEYTERNILRLYTSWGVCPNE